jgi:hypothetical protein
MFPGQPDLAISNWNSLCLRALVATKPVCASNKFPRASISHQAHARKGLRRKQLGIDLPRSQ